MGRRVSKCLRQDGDETKGQLGPRETPRGNHVDRVTLLPIGIRTIVTFEGSPPTTISL
jgi:hypothetical protein